MHETSNHRLLFITGTDTGVGKTLLTALLLSHLRRRKVPVLAIKPFCSGNRGDVQLLHSLQGGDLTLDEINPFFFPEPLAPFVAARQDRRPVQLEEVLAYIRSVAKRLVQSKIESQKSRIRPTVLLIEGAGGLLVPLGPNYFVLDVIRELRCEVIVVSCNKLGTLNHTLLTIQALQNGCPHLFQQGKPLSRAPMASVVLMEQSRQDVSASYNPRILTEFLAPVQLWKLAYFGKNCHSPGAIGKISKKIQKTLARIVF